MAARQFLLLSFVIAGMVVIPSNAQLSLDFSNCKLSAMTAIRSVVYEAIKEEKRMGASLLRMHFHDCFVQGCDGSILLDDINGNFTGEKTAVPNKNSVRGFEIIDAIKTKVDNVCGKGKVSCADIIAVAARDSIDILGGPYYSVKVGRKDSKTASLNLANANLPPSASNLSQLLTKFQAQQLNLKDLVALSGAHTIGKGRCINFRNRIYTDGENIDQTYKMTLQNICPSTGEDDNLAACDVTTKNSFDTAYYRNLLVKKGLFHSDQELYKGDGSEADALVTKYAKNYLAFKSDFINAMIKMGDLKNTDEGEIRNNCRVVNG